jgi:signal transduction histidine kinase
MVNAAVATIQPAADARAVRVEVSAPASVAPVWGDPDRLQQIAWNLLSNAVKFTPRGGAVDVRVEQRDGWVCLVVADNGQGIAPEFLPHIFERFSQADCRSSHEHGGLGLGLAIVRELTELHGGVVSAASEGADKGAIFTVFLPPLREEADRALEPPPDEDDDVAPHAAS